MLQTAGLRWINRDIANNFFSEGIWQKNILKNFPQVNTYPGLFFHFPSLNRQKNLWLQKKIYFKFSNWSTFEQEFCVFWWTPLNSFMMCFNFAIKQLIFYENRRLGTKLDFEGIGRKKVLVKGFLQIKTKTVFLIIFLSLMFQKN